MRKLSVRLSVRPSSVRPSVRLSTAFIATKRKKDQSRFYIIRKIIQPSFLRRRLVGGGSKTQNGRFRSKIALRSKKVCYKVSLCKNCQLQSCKAFIGLTIRAKMIGGGDPFYLKSWIKLTAFERNRRFSHLFSLVATQSSPSEKSSININRKSTIRAFQ